MLIEPCTPAELPEWVAMRRGLWPEYDERELEAGAAEMLGDADALVLIARAQTGEATGLPRPVSAATM